MLNGVVVFQRPHQASSRAGHRGRKSVRFIKFAYWNIELCLNNIGSIAVKANKIKIDPTSTGKMTNMFQNTYE